MDHAAPPPEIDALRRAAEAPVRAGSADLPQVANDLTLAFADDPMFAWFMRTDAQRGPALRRFFDVVLRDACLPDGEVNRPAGGGAATVWMPSEKLAQWPWMRDVRALPMLLHASGLSRFGRLLRLRKAMDDEHDLERPHDYLWFLGVRPDLQGLGLGSRLLAAHCARLDAAGRAAFLHTATPRNLGLYKRYGFEVVAEYTPPPDGPLSWAMWRDPSAE